MFPEFLAFLVQNEKPLHVISNLLSALGYILTGVYAFGHARDRTVNVHRALAWVVSVVFAVKGAANLFSAWQVFHHGAPVVATLMYIFAAIVFLAFVPVLAASNDDVRNTLRTSAIQDRLRRHARRGIVQIQTDTHSISVAAREDSERLVEWQRKEMKRHDGQVRPRR